MARGVEHTCACVGHMGDDGDEFEFVHEFNGVLTCALQSERDHSAGAVGHLFLCQLIIFVAFEPCIVHPAHLRMLLEPLSHLQRVLAVARHAEMQCLQTDVEQERVVG